MSREPAYVGKRFTIRFLELADGSCPAWDFLESLGESDRSKMSALFAWFGDNGPILNKQKFKKIEESDKIYEFKSFKVRMFCFYDGREVLLEDGVIKKQDKHKSADIDRAEKWRRWYFTQK